MGKPSTTPEVNIAAEARAVEAGHHAWVQEGGWVKVTSDSFAGKWYEVIFVSHIDGLVTFTCRPHGRAAYQEDHLYASSGRPGQVPCMHAALAARRLEREGLAELDGHGRWVATEKAMELVRARLAAATPANLLDGLPQ